jgi:hypothetical protein
VAAAALANASVTEAPAAPDRAHPVATHHCGGVERWAVKTLSDGVPVNFQPQTTTVSELRRKRPPIPPSTEPPRMAPVETKTWRLRQVYLVEARHVARLKNGKREDMDYHLVIRTKRGRTMIVEFPDPDCRGAAQSPKRAAMRAAREAFLHACGPIPQSFVELRGRATIEGVGFFDEVHGQRGVAKPSGIELHPVLSFTQASCARG